MGCGNARAAVRNSVDRPLHGLLNPPGTETTCTDPNPMARAVDQRPDRLEIGLEDAFGLVVRMTDIVSGVGFLSTHATGIGHGSNSSSGTRLFSVVVRTGEEC